jgi:hypothetical protein
MKTASYFAIAVVCAGIAGCGGGGGGGGTPGPTPIALGTFNSATDRTTASTAFTANVTGANSNGTTVQLYGDERAGPVNAYTSSHRLTLTLYGTATAGSAFTVSTSHAAGTANATYLETTQTDGAYTTTGTWNGTDGVVSITEANGSHIAGTCTLNTRNAANGNVIHWTSGAFNLAFETPPPPPQ